MKFHSFDNLLVWRAWIILLFLFLQTRNTKKAEDNVSSLEKEIEENSTNMQRFDVSIDSVKIKW